MGFEAHPKTRCLQVYTLYHRAVDVDPLVRAPAFVVMISGFPAFAENDGKVPHHVR